MTDSENKIIDQHLSRYLARREYSCHELVYKLQAKGFEFAAITARLQYWQSRDWQSDRRFALQLVRDRVSKGYGQRRIRSELQEHQISSSEVQEVFALIDTELEVDWFELALHVTHKKFGANPPADNVRKIQQYLYRRGFDYEQIQYALNP